jgi:hypothetical protein
VDMADGEATSLIYKERVVRVSASIISDGPARTCRFRSVAPCTINVIKKKDEWLARFPPFFSHECVAKTRWTFRLRARTHRAPSRKVESLSG